MWVFFFNDTATTEIYTLSLHDALPILISSVSVALTLVSGVNAREVQPQFGPSAFVRRFWRAMRSEEHTPELQSRQYPVCRLLLEKKNIFRQTLHFCSSPYLSKKQRAH